MPSKPTLSSVHEDVLLTETSLAYRNGLGNFIYPKLPTIPVAKQSNKYRTYDKNDWFRDEFEKLGPGSESAGLTYGLANATYSCDVWAGHHDVDEQTRVNYDEPGDAETDAAEHLTQVGMIRAERQWATDAFATSIWTGSSTGGDITPSPTWDDGAGSDPGSDVDTECTALLQNTGMKPNTFIVGHEVHQKLKRHPNIIESIKYTRSGAQAATHQELAAYFEVDNYWVANATYSTTDEDASTETYALIAGKNAWLGYLEPNPGHMKPSALYVFVWSALTGMNDMGMRVLNIPIPHRHSDRIEVQLAFDIKVVAADLGVFFSGAVA